MLSECDVPYANMQKLRSLERIIEQGDCEDYKKAMEIRRHSKYYSFDELVYTLKEEYKKLKMKQMDTPDQTEKAESRKQTLPQGDSANTTQSGLYNNGNNSNIVNVNNELTWCEKCSRYHRGQHNDDLAKKAKKAYKKFKRDETKEKHSANTTEKI
jgi:hypothetical protein